MQYYESPITYMGSKRRLLPQLLSLFPKNIDTFYDLFTGSGTVSFNVKANKIISNDKDETTYKILSFFKNNDLDKLGYEVLQFLELYHLEGKDKEKQYYKLRDFYNKSTNKSIFILYILTVYSFSSLARFNSKGEFNMPFGNRDFSVNKFNNIRNLREVISNIEFCNQDFSCFEDFKKGDFVYLDPPYLLTEANYNDNWTDEDDLRLFKYLDKLDKQGIKWGMSNVFQSKGNINSKLIEWSKKYNVTHLNYHYKTTSGLYKSQGQDNVTDEVFICNYQTKKNTLF